MDHLESADQSAHEQAHVDLYDYRIIGKIQYVPIIKINFQNYIKGLLIWLNPLKVFKTIMKLELTGTDILDISEAETDNFMV